MVGCDITGDVLISHILGYSTGSVCVPRVLVVALVVILAAPASSQNLLNILAHIVRDLPALGQAISTPLHSKSTSAHFRQQTINSKGDEVAERYCFGELGCLETGSDFYHPKYRPLNLQPESRETINVLFTIYSRQDLLGVVVSAQDVQQVLKSSFRPNRKTKIIIHGYLNGRDMPWLTDIASAFLRTGDYNVIMVDWTDGSLGLYGQTVANARVAGLEVAHLITWLRDNTGHRPQDVHIIGHSLGAHVSGYTGERVPKLGRISGLDPAEPYFQYMPSSVRLDPTDALFVDVIHTDGAPFSLDGGYGLKEPAGHLDFYPNGGQNQTGCETPLAAPIRWFINGKNFTRAWNVVEDALGCNHLRAAFLFRDSIDSQCPYIAFSCHSYQQYRQGKCFSCGEDGTRCASMGFYADTWPGRGQVGLKFYLTTGPVENLCLYHFRLRLQLGAGPGTTMAGQLSITFFTNNGHTIKFDLLTTTIPQRLEHGKRYTFLVEHGEDLSKIQYAHFTWIIDGSSYIPASDGPLPLSSVSIFNIEKSVQRERSGGPLLGSEEVVLCPGGKQNDVLVGSGETVQLLTSPTCFSA
ncbi:pancreatic triacylglycerol lipase-like [Cherax quadricarinatus]|uniref:pancreatic triacylglycerol lipase-like n=1 Tax=Cherax quadricarinatus TaxID=27406 RepID=UPI00387E4E89